MPRKRKTQPVQDIPNQPYGMGQDLTEMQQQAPLPQVGVDVGMPERGSTPYPEVLRQAQEFAGPLETPMTAMSQRPSEPVTTGLKSGPGAGPEALFGAKQRRNPRAEILEAIAATSTNPRVTSLARRARMTG